MIQPSLPVAVCPVGEPGFDFAFSSDCLQVYKTFQAKLTVPWAERFGSLQPVVQGF
jgi:hypothetical protein